MAGRILIVDSVVTNRIALKVKLASASYDVAQAASGDEALAVIAAGRPDLVLLDAQLSDIDGIDLCAMIRKDPATAAVPVVLIMPGPDAGARLAALRAGAAEILSKPLHDTTLLATLRNLLRLRGVDQELRLRESTALELGFSEAASTFTQHATVLLVQGTAGAPAHWRKALGDARSLDITVLHHDRVLKAISGGDLKPDIVVLPAGTDTAQNGLTLLAELRSRSATRHAAILVYHDRDGAHSAISALDMGASDVLDIQASGEEFLWRLQGQLERKRKSDRLRLALADGLRLAVTDPLTGLFNRRYALPHLARIAERSRETGVPFAVMVLDLDRFKRINDTHGHSTGDLVLREVARRLHSNVRSVDMVARIGGEEFLIVMPDTELAPARIAAERLRRVISARPVRVSQTIGEVPVTASIGVSLGGLDVREPASPQSVVDKADQAMLGSKMQGRNQVTFGKSAA